MTFTINTTFRLLMMFAILGVFLFSAKAEDQIKKCSYKDTKQYFSVVSSNCSDFNFNSNDNVLPSQISPSLREKKIEHCLAAMKLHLKYSVLGGECGLEGSRIVISRSLFENKISRLKSELERIDSEEGSLSDARYD